MPHVLAHLFFCLLPLLLFCFEEHVLEVLSHCDVISVAHDLLFVLVVGDVDGLEESSDPFVHRLDGRRGKVKHLFRRVHQLIRIGQRQSEAQSTTQAKHIPETGAADASGS